MFKASFLAILFVASASAFAPTLQAPARLPARQALSLRKTGVTMAQQQENKAPAAFANGALSLLVATSLFAGMPADASINSQMSMDSSSFSVLSDNQKVYQQKARAVNPYASEEEQMRQLERIARLEECTAKGTSMGACEAREQARNEQVMAQEATKRRSPLTFAVPIIITTALSGVLIKVLNR